MLCNVGDPMETTRLAEAAGPAVQSELIAVDVCPVKADPAARVMPLV
jgi:hypothetical protein